MAERLLGVIAYVALGGAAIAVVWSSWPASAVSQPLPFPHEKHMALDMECASCHTGALREAGAGIPSAHTCALCHRTDRAYPPTPPELADYLLTGKSIPWVQVHRVPRHVYFSHRRHVVLAGLACEECHGEIRSAAQPVTRPYFPMGQAGMDRCVDCHRREKVTTDCLSCHR